MKTYISAGDFIDSYYRVKNRGLSFFLSRLGFTSARRVKGAWNYAAAIEEIRWWEIPAVRERRNMLRTGDTQLETSEYIFRKFFNNKKNLTVLSPGCGTGDKEIALSLFPQIAKLDAFDIAEKRISEAKKKAEEKHINKLNFFTADISAYDFGENKYDIIIFDSFLHHVKDVNKILTKTKEALKGEGLLIIDEYVGPNRFQWEKEALDIANRLLAELPEKLKRRTNGKIKRKIYRPGIWRMILSDPSEAVNSEAILPELEKHFLPVEVHPYGGNILQLLLKDIERNFLNLSDERKILLQKIFDAEDNFINHNKSDFLFGIFKPKMDKI